MMNVELIESSNDLLDQERAFFFLEDSSLLNILNSEKNCDTVH